jgi:hypothetical protein
MDGKIVRDGPAGEAASPSPIPAVCNGTLNRSSGSAGRIDHDGSGAWVTVLPTFDLVTPSAGCAMPSRQDGVSGYGLCANGFGITALCLPPPCGLRRHSDPANRDRRDRPER